MEIIFQKTHSLNFKCDTFHYFLIGENELEINHFNKDPIQGQADNFKFPLKLLYVLQKYHVWPQKYVAQP